MEVFMDDFSIYGGLFEKCLDNLGIVLQRCRERNLVLNWGKWGTRRYCARKSYFI